MKSEILFKAANAYARVFSIPALRGLNRTFLRLAIKAEGYNNHRNSAVSGESYFIEKILKPSKPRVCVDVGANVGSYTEMLLEETEAFVFSFEPLSKPYEKVREISDEYPGRCKVIKKGVGSRNEVLEIHFSDDATFHASFSEEMKSVSYVKNEKRESVEVITLDTFFEIEEPETIDFIKIDTEGFESDVLDGAKQIISKYKPKFIQIEYNWHQLIKSVSLYQFSILLADYDVYQLLPNRWIKREPSDPYANIFHFSNFVFVRRDQIMDTG